MQYPVEKPELRKPYNFLELKLYDYKVPAPTCMFSRNDFIF
jgi:hypothetical protein